MPYLQAATSNPFGFQPVEGAGSRGTITAYPVSTSYGTAIYPGDIVTVTTSAGFLQVATTGSASVAGVAAEFCAASLSSKKYIGVYSDPDQVYVALKSTAEATGVAGLFIGFQTSLGGNTNTNRSQQMIGGADAPCLTTTGGIIKMLGPHPVENITNTSSGFAANLKMLCKIGIHAFAGINRTT